MWIAAGVCYLLGMTCGAKILYDLRISQLDFSALLTAQRWTRGGMWGGLPAYFALAVPLILVLAKDRRAGLDLIAVSIPIPWMLAKLGCFLNGCCYGRPTSLPWAVVFPKGARWAPPGIAIHPTQIYEILIMATILVVFSRLKANHWRGTKLLWFLTIYGFARATTDFLRGDAPERLVGPLSLTQLICLATAGSGLLILLRLQRGAPDKVIASL